MCKELIKNILIIQKNLLQFLPHIPKVRVTQINKDIQSLFKDIEKKEIKELKEIEKLAKSKLSAFKRLYTPIQKEKDSDEITKNIQKSTIEYNNSNQQNENVYKNTITSSDQINDNDKIDPNIYNDSKVFENNTTYILNKKTKIELETVTFNESKTKYNIKQEDLDKLNKLNSNYEKDNDDVDLEKMYNEIKSTYFNKEKIKNYQDQYEKLSRDKREDLINKEKLRLIEVMRNKNIENTKDSQDIKNNIKGNIKQSNDQMKAIEESISFRSSLFTYRDENNVEVIDKLLVRKHIKDFYDILGIKGGEELEKNYDPDTYYKKGSHILEGSSSTDFMKPTKDELNDNVQKFEDRDGEIELGLFGDFKYTSYVPEGSSNYESVEGFKRVDISKAEDDKVKELNDKLFGSKSNSSGESNINNENDTRDKFIWKDGKLVPGQGKLRKVSTIVNWNSSNLDPKELNKHRELLDRQHFLGPLWDGIKKKSLYDEPLTITEKDLDNAISKEEFDDYKKQNAKKQKVVEIVR